MRGYTHTPPPPDIVGRLPTEDYQGRPFHVNIPPGRKDAESGSAGEGGMSPLDRYTYIEKTERRVGRNDIGGVKIK